MEGLKEALREVRVLAKQVFGIEPRVPQVVHPRLEFHGSTACGWKIVEGSLNKGSIVVDVGLGEDTTFSESINRKYGCVVNGFDPTPRAIQHVKNLRNPGIRLFEVGLGPEAGPTTFFLPNIESHVSGSVTLERHLGRRHIDVEIFTLGQVFETVGCDRIDVLKLDIEGTEYDVIQSPDFRKYASSIDQLCVEFHHRWKGRGKRSTETAVMTLRNLGFDCAWYSRSTNEEFLFVRRLARLSCDE